MEKYRKIIIGTFIAVLFIVAAYKRMEKNVTDRVNFNFAVEGTASDPVDTVSLKEHEQTYSKVIDTVKLELIIPDEWNYEEIQNNEESDSYKHSLKLYKHNENEYAMIYLYDTSFGVCGTGRTSENISLHNGVEATIGYYDGNEDWNDISFYDRDNIIVVMNYGLTDSDAEEAIEIMKTMEMVKETQEG